MAGKYSGVVDDLPRFNGNEASYQDHVNQRKAELLAKWRGAGDAMTAVGLANEYAILRAAKDQVEAEAKEIGLSIEAVSLMLVDQYEGEGTTSVRLSGGGSVSVQLEPYATVRDKDANRLWAVANGMERLLALPWGTVNSYAKEALLAGLPLPDGVEIFAKAKLFFRKG